MFRAEGSGTGWSQVVLTWMFVLRLFSADWAGSRPVEAVSVGDGGSANGSAVLFRQEPPPAFRTAVNLVIMDVQVVAAQGKPMPGLTSAQFDVSIAGHKRRVVLAEFVHADEGPITNGPSPAHRTAACAFGFERSAKGVNAHYLLGVEPRDTDKGGIRNPKVKMNDK